MMEPLQGEDSQRQPVRRPVLLTVACILSYLGSGAGLFSYLVVSFSYQKFMSAFQEMTLDMPGFEMLREASRGFFISGMVLFLGSFTGVWLMWKLRKAGFHLYLMAQVLLLIQPYLYLDLHGFPLFQVAGTGIFLLVYGLHLKIMS